MIIVGKLFGSIGPATPAVSPVSETARPGYGAWYAQQMARSYALLHAAHRDLPLAA